MTAASMTLAVVCMPERGHAQRLVPLVAGLAARGHAVHVFGDVRFAPDVVHAGGRFHDLFTDRPLDAVDATSLPVPSRYVTFAAAHADALATEIGALGPRLLVYDTFAVVAPIVARRLGIPWVNVAAGHASVPARTRAALRIDPRVATSDACHAAVRVLRERHGMPDASPFSYVDGVSPFLNLYGEPPAFLDDTDRDALEPLAFFGALAPAERDAAAGPSPFPARRRRAVYVSFGTVIWRYFEDAAFAALAALAVALADRDVDVVMSLGGHALDPVRRARLAQPNVRVESYVDQWAALRDADVFVTHHGLNSTHEAIFHGVPMVSHPFFGDQPALATRSQALGLAVPLVPSPGAPIERDAMTAALATLDAGRDTFAARLAEARTWELATIAGRDAVLDRMLALA